MESIGDILERNIQERNILTSNTWQTGWEKVAGEGAVDVFEIHDMICQRWDYIAAEHQIYCRPGKLDLDKAELCVLAESPSHATVLNWSCVEMLERATEVLGEGILRTLKVMVVSKNTS